MFVIGFKTLDFLARCGKDFGHKEIRNCGLNDTEFILCSFVHFNPGCTQDDVVSGVRIDKTTAAKAFSSLEGKNLLVRKSDASDRRRKKISLTADGEEKISKIINVHDKWMNSILSVLSDDEQKQFEGFCNRLMKAAKELEQ